MSRLAVFGYGSLVDAVSAGTTLGRPVAETIPARLEGWRREWTLRREQARSEKAFARPDGTVPRFCVGLNLERGAADGSEPPNGALIELTEAELDRLDLREIRYHRAEVTDLVRTSDPHGFDRIVTYEARPENHLTTPHPDTILVASYLVAVEAAFDALGPGELEAFRATTPPPAVEITEATLVRDEIPPGNPRAW